MIGDPLPDTGFKRSIPTKSIELPFGDTGSPILRLGFGWDLSTRTSEVDVGVFVHRADDQSANDQACMPFEGSWLIDAALLMEEGGYLDDDDVTLRIDLRCIRDEVRSYDIVWKIRDVDARNPQISMAKNAYMRIADKPFRWDALDHPIDTQDMTSSQLLVARLVRNASGWSLIKDTRQL